MIQHEYAQGNGFRLHYVTAGAGPLLLFMYSQQRASHYSRTIGAGYRTDSKVHC